jgi:hypothetical protein
MDALQEENMSNQEQVSNQMVPVATGKTWQNREILKLAQSLGLKVKVLQKYSDSRMNGLDADLVIFDEPIDATSG